MSNGKVLANRSSSTVTWSFQEAGAYRQLRRNTSITVPASTTSIWAQTDTGLINIVLAELAREREQYLITDSDLEANDIIIFSLRNSLLTKVGIAVNEGPVVIVEAATTTFLLNKEPSFHLSFGDRRYSPKLTLEGAPYLVELLVTNNRLSGLVEPGTAINAWRYTLRGDELVVDRVNSVPHYAYLVTEDEVQLPSFDPINPPRYWSWNGPIVIPVNDETVIQVTQVTTTSQWWIVILVVALFLVALVAVIALVFAQSSSD